MPILRVIQNDIEKTIPFQGTPMLTVVLERHGYSIAHPCGGRGACKKCAVEVRGAVSAPNLAELHAKTRLECQVRLLGNCTVILPQTKDITVELQGISPMIQPEGAEGYGAALDVGTTTLALRLYALSDGRCVGEAGMLNPQTAVAADVMGRIQTALEGGLIKLQAQVNQVADRLLDQAAQRAQIDPEKVHTMVVTGNTTMLYLFTGRNPQSLSRAPFEADCLFGLWEQQSGKQMYFPRCMNAFVGADIACAVLASGMCRQAKPALLCDIGTNGEIALWKEGRLYVTSTAAGPAFEGAGISCGCSSVPGAVDRVWLESGQPRVNTIGEAQAAGICGSGLIDAVSALLQTGDVDETGRMEPDTVTLAAGVSLMPADIRAVQLAKAAIAAGIRTLLHEADTAMEEIQSLFIAGGFGNHLNLENAAAIGLVPSVLVPRAYCIGNAALAGAADVLLNKSALQEADNIAELSIHINLGGNSYFNECYMEQMMF